MRSTTGLSIVAAVSAFATLPTYSDAAESADAKLDADAEPQDNADRFWALSKLLNGNDISMADVVGLDSNKDGSPSSFAGEDSNRPGFWPMLLHGAKRSVDICKG